MYDERCIWIWISIWICKQLELFVHCGKVVCLLVSIRVHTHSLHPVHSVSCLFAVVDNPAARRDHATCPEQLLPRLL